MKHLYFWAMLLLAALPMGMFAQPVITGAGSALTLTFNGFAGAGFTPTPAAGELDSDAWESTGFSSGAMTFGGSFTTGDFARGVTTGGVGSGGIYAYDDGTNQALWIQPTGSDFTPGTLTLLVTNGSGVTFTELDIAYDLLVLNDADRGNTFNCSISTDNVTFTPIPALDYLSPEAQDGSFNTINQSATVTGLSIADGDSIFIRWESDDNLGGGSRDEFGLDNISLTGTAGAPTPPEVGFASAGQVVLESVGTVSVDLNVSFSDTCAVEVSIGAGGSAMNVMDYTFSDPDTVFFLNGGSNVGSTSLDIIDDAITENSETVILVLDSVFNCAVGAVDTFTLTIDDNDQMIPVYAIGLVTDDANADGVGDSLGVECELRGVVHGVDLQGSGSIQFTFIDPTGGISLFSGNNFGYTVMEGDSVHVQGTITEFNGLTQIAPDAIQLISSGNALQTPLVITSLDETTESELVRFNNAFIIDPAQWTGTGSGFNVDVTNGTDTIQLRIDNDVDLYSQPAPGGIFDVIGLGGQFDNSVPKTEGYQLLPRYQPDILPVAVPGFSFTPPSAISTDEAAGTINFEISLASAFPVPTSVEVVLGTSSTATDGVDFNGWNDSVINFPANVTGPFALSLSILDDNLAEVTETIVLELINPTGGPVLGDSVLTISITDNDYPVRTIAEMTQDLDGNGETDSIGVRCELRGIVHGTNQQDPASGRINFAFIDNTGGMVTFSNNNFGYTVNQGDEVVIQGTISSFNGLAQISPDTVVRISGGNPISMPMVVDSLGEFTEGEYIQLNCFRFVNESDWPTGGSANLDITNGVDTLSMRIDADTELGGTAVPASPFNVRGLGWQFDNSDPRTEGYQIIPQFIVDFDSLPLPEASFRTDTLIVEEPAGVIEIPFDYLNGNGQEFLVSFVADAANSTATAVDDYALGTDQFSFASVCGADSGMLQLGVIDDADLEGEETLLIRLFLQLGQLDFDTAELVVLIQDDEVASTKELTQGAIEMYPNPAHTQVSLRANLFMESVKVWDMMGREVLNQSLNGLDATLSVAHLQAGVYTFKVVTPEGIWTGKLIRE